VISVRKEGNVSNKYTHNKVRQQDTFPLTLYVADANAAGSGDLSRKKCGMNRVFTR
jgi:hypothetical protein